MNTQDLCCVPVSHFSREEGKEREYDDACQLYYNPRYGEALRTGHDLADSILRHVQEQPIQRARTKAHGGNSRGRCFVLVDGSAPGQPAAKKAI